MKKKHLIYLVDDNRFNLLSISKKLKSALNCDIICFKTALNCVLALEEQEVDLIVSDVNLSSNKGDMEGTDLVDAAARKQAAVPVILYSSGESFSVEAQEAISRADDFVPCKKGFQKKLAHTVRKKLIDIKETRKRRNKRSFIIVSVISALLALIGFFLAPAYASIFYFVALGGWMISVGYHLVSPIFTSKSIVKTNEPYLVRNVENQPILP